MKSKTIPAMTLAITAALVACGGAQQGQPAGMQGAAGMTDAEIAAVLDAVNRAEVQQAEMAQERAETDEVRSYASRMLNEHQNAMERQDMLLQERGIPTRDNAVSQQVEQQAMQTQRELANLQGEDFDRAYVQAQMRQHERVISILEQQLIPAAQDPEYRMYLQQQLATLNQQLQWAEQLQQQMQMAG
jgi:putative membrane protein